MKIHNDSLAGLRKLKKIVLRRMWPLDISCDDPFRDLQELKILDMRTTLLAYGRVDCVDLALRHLPNLEYLAVQWPAQRLTTGFSYLKMLKILDLTSSSISVTRQAFTVLSNLSIERLSLNNCGGPKLHFEPLALSELTHLKVVDISCNYIGTGENNASLKWTEILRSFQNISLHTLIMDRVMWPGHGSGDEWPTTLSGDVFKPLRDIQLVQLSLQDNFITVVEPFLTYLHHLEYINADYNTITFIKQITNIIPRLHPIKEVHATHQYNQFGVYNGDKSAENPLFLNANISLRSHQRYHRPITIVPLNLDRLFISHNPALGSQIQKCTKIIDLSHITYHGYNFKLKNNLTYVDGSSSGLHTIPCVVIGLNHLQEVKLDNNNMEYVPPRFFNSFPNLEKLWLSRNRFGLFTTTENLIEIFRDMTNLRYLDLGDNFLERLPEGLFDNCSKLEILKFAGNALYSLEYTFSNLPNLKSLDLSRNLLQGLNETQLKEFENIASGHELTVKFDKSENLQCSCDYIPFIKWVQDSMRKTIIPNASNLTCSSLTGNRVKLAEVDINNLYLECIKSEIIISVSACVLFILILCVTIWYYRWTLKYRYYKYKVGRKPVNVNIHEPYDVYISYPEIDLQWAENIRQKLEEEMNLAVFFPARDFIPGENICEATVRGIDTSKKSLICINENFNECEYHNFAVQMSCVRGRGFVIPILKRNFPLNKLPRLLRYLLRDDVYLDWPKEGDNEEKFWKRLKKAITTAKGVYIKKNGRIVVCAN